MDPQWSNSTAVKQVLHELVYFFRQKIDVAVADFVGSLPAVYVIMSTPVRDFDSGFELLALKKTIGTFTQEIRDQASDNFKIVAASCSPDELEKLAVINKHLTDRSLRIINIFELAIDQKFHDLMRCEIGKTLVESSS